MGTVGTRLGAVLGATVGGVVGLLGPLPPAPVEEVWIARAPVEEEVVRSVAAPCPGLDERSQERLDRVWDRREEAARAVEEAEQDLEAFLGDALPFEDLPIALRPEALEESVERSVDPDTAEIQWIDCAEAPCIAVLRLVADDISSVEAMQDGFEPLRRGLGVDLGFEWAAPAEGLGYLTVPLGPDGLSDTLEHRIDVREEAIISELARAAKP